MSWVGKLRFPMKLRLKNDGRGALNGIVEMSVAIPGVMSTYSLGEIARRKSGRVVSA